MLKQKIWWQQKGRASYLKERSIGTIDPGSFSTGIILKNFLKEL
ncbi:DAK2 domain-containing protein [Mycoplasmopsis cynos]